MLDLKEERDTMSRKVEPAIPWGMLPADVVLIPCPAVIKLSVEETTQTDDLKVVFVDSTEERTILRKTRTDKVNKCVKKRTFSEDFSDVYGVDQVF